MFTQQPLSMNYIIGEEFLFTCSASNADILSFLVNGISAGNEIIIDQGYTESGIDDNGDILARNLTGIAQIDYNGSNISCVAVSFVQVDTVFISNVAVYQIQGNNNYITLSIIIVIIFTHTWRVGGIR